MMVGGVLPNVGKEIIVVDDCSKDGTREWLKANFPHGARSGASISRGADGNIEFGNAVNGATDHGPANLP